jgi:hypothetical protein
MDSTGAAAGPPPLSLFLLIRQNKKAVISFVVNFLALIFVYVCEH